MLFLKSIINKMKIYFLHDNKWGNLVYVLLFISFILIIATGIISYSRISDSLSNLKSRINQDEELNAIKSIHANYNKIDNMLEMYVITHRKPYLKQLDSVSFETRIAIVNLKLSRKINEKEKMLIDSLKIILNQKVRNIANIVRFQQDRSIERLIEDYMNMQSIRSAMDRAEIEATRRKLTFNKNKKVRKELATADSLLEAAENNKGDIIELAENRSINPYLQKDHEFNLHYNQICNILEETETNRLDMERIYTESTIKTANKSVIWLGACTALFILLAGLFYFRYINKLAKIQKKLSESKDIAEELTVIKERFMANMSHEIRTPLNAISGFVDQLHSSNLSHFQRKQTEIIQKSIQHILNIVNDILDFSKLNAKRLELNRKGFELEPTIHQSLELLEPLVSEKNILLQCRIDKGLPEVMLGDAYRIRQILLNIIGNAIKYTVEGGINVHVKHKILKDNICEVEFEVKDTGIGIEVEELKNIFKEFHMAENAARWNKAGSSGLGLSITKMLVDLHHGNIDIKSNINKGTTVSIQLPLGIGKKSDLEDEFLYLKDLNFLNNKNIIIADDEPFNRVLLNNILHKYSVKTFEAENGLQVLSILEKESIDCILMDVKMPELNGIQTTLRIRQLNDSVISSIPIIAVSAAITHDNLRTFMNNGVELFLEKPFKESELLNLLYKTLKNNQVEIVSDETNIDNLLPPIPDKPFDLSELQRQAGTDPDFIIDMLETLFISTRKGIDELENDLRNKRWDNINLVSHRIASPLRFIMAKQAYESAKKIEMMTETNVEIDKKEIDNQIQLFKNQYQNLESQLKTFIKTNLATANYKPSID
jgi:signal transduction histidine kinase/CheY-like chemotaxis protein/HPt (histidine-containing phosphotransfer) domain-containing protein